MIRLATDSWESQQAAVECKCCAWHTCIVEHACLAERITHGTQYLGRRVYQQHSQWGTSPGGRGGREVGAADVAAGLLLLLRGSGTNCTTFSAEIASYYSTHLALAALKQSASSTASSAVAAVQ